MGRKVKKGKKNCGKKKCKVEKSEVNEEKGEKIVEETLWLDCFGEGKAVDPVAAEFCSIFQDLQCNKLSEKQVKVSEEIVRENNSTDELGTNKTMGENIEEFGDNDGKVENSEVDAADFLNTFDETTKEVHDMEPIEIELEETLIEDLKQIRDVDDQLSFLTVDIISKNYMKDENEGNSKLSDEVANGVIEQDETETMEIEINVMSHKEELDDEIVTETDIDDDCMDDIAQSFTSKTKTSSEKTATFGRGDMILKHPLEHEWTFWYYYPEKRQSWSANQKMVLTVSTVEDFWAVYNNILQPSQLKVNSDYSLFKSGIKPDWEDLGNIHGGRWVTTCPRERLDVGWKELVMALIGEQMGDGLRDTVTGAVVNVRSKGDKLAVWVGDDSDLVEASVGVHISRILGLYEMRRLEYKRFKP